MIHKIVFTVIVLLLCSSCINRTTYKGSEMNGSKRVIDESTTVWFWDKDF